MYQMAYTVMYPLHDLLWMNQELIILISMASYWDELNQENDHSIFVSENDTPGLPLGGRTLYITSKNRLRTPKLHIKDVPRTSENSLVLPKMDIETSGLQKKPAHIYQIT